jgi:hypothetical protein
MESFVNRVSELQLIDDVFAALLDNNRLLKTPILALHGVQGIGKSTVLRRIEQRCEDERLPCIRTGVYRDMADCSRTILAQVGKYGQIPAISVSTDDWLERSIFATRTLLRLGPAVMLIDSFDATNGEHLRWFEEFLKNVIDESKLFVVFTSQRRFLFARERSVARKVTSLELRPFDRESCQQYIDAAGMQLEGELRDLLFAWTRGYPLAMQIMVQSMATGLDPRKEADRQMLLTTLMERVVEQHILARVNPARLAWYRTILRLLSVPRRFNLVMLRELIERFAPDLRRESNLAYFVLPKEINELTDVLPWNMLRAGFSVDAPVRNLFLLELKIAYPDLYTSIHDFLAQINRSRAQEVRGSDRSRYLREFLYHTACKGQTPDFPEQIRVVIEQMAQEVPTPDMFVQFSEEFQQDEELQEALGTARNRALSLLQRKLAHLNRQLALQTAGPGRVRFLREFFYHLMQDPQATDLARDVKQQMELLIANETSDVVSQLYDELAHSERFRTLLGKDLETVAMMVRKNRPFEG